MNQPYLLGIDLGTTATKVAVFAPTGRILALHQAPTPMHWDGVGEAHHDPEALWQTVVGLIRSLDAEVRKKVASIGVSSFGEAGVLLGPKGEPVGPVLAWFDARPKQTFSALTEWLPPEDWRVKVGLRPDFTYGLPKLVWLQKNHPEHLRGAIWLPVADFIANRLSGEVSIGITQASRTAAFDIAKNAWFTEAWEALGLLGVRPPLRSPGQPVGKVSAEAAALTGLEVGAAIAETGHDQPLAAVGVGAMAAGDRVNSCGTAEVLLGVMKAADVGTALQAPGVAVGPYALPGMCYALTTLRASGSTWDWLVRLASGVHPVDHTELIERSTRVPSGSEGLRFLPYLRPQSDDPQQPQLSSGVFVGLQDSHSMGHLGRAVLEGLSFELWRAYQRMPQLQVKRVHPLRAVGGATQNALWMQIKANFLQSALETYRSPHAAVWGAAWLAGHSLGWVPPYRPPAMQCFEPGPPETALLGDYQKVLNQQLLAEGQPQ